MLWETKDYRKFLLVWFEAEKIRNPRASLSSIGSRLNLDPTLLGRIMQGERHLATSRIQMVCDLIGLKGDLSDYFRHLVLLAKSKSAREAQACQDRLRDLRRVMPSTLSHDQESFWDSWVNVALYTVVACDSFGDEWEVLGSLLQPPQSPDLVKSAMETLERLGMISKSEGGIWQPSHRFVRDRRADQSRSLRNFHRQNLLLALHSLDNIPVADRNVSSVTIAIDAPAYHDLLQMIEGLRAKAMSRSEKVIASDQVVQLNIQMFPLTSPGALPRNKRG